MFPLHPSLPAGEYLSLFAAGGGAIAFGIGHAHSGKTISAYYVRQSDPTHFCMCSQFNKA